MGQENESKASLSSPKELVSAALSAHTCASISWPTVAESSQAFLAKVLSETSSDDESEQMEEDRSVHTHALMRFALLFLVVIGYFDSQTGGDLWTPNCGYSFF